ncbi:hypothetical protein BDW22DRAFT_1424454 [Trametopsis cervina]|nr:hypothetical protein BDW22DRAFT_1424454 [Trametopsis cervina]
MTARPSAPKTSFREVPVAQRSIWQSWAVLPAKTRLRVSLALTGVALAGMFISDKLEQALPEGRGFDQAAKSD